MRNFINKIFKEPAQEDHRTDCRQSINLKNDFKEPNYFIRALFVFCIIFSSIVIYANRSSFDDWPYMLIAIIGILILLYFLPTFVAGARNHPDAGAIAIINLLIGWLFVPWVIALAWACKSIDDGNPQMETIQNDSGKKKKCPFCAEEIKAEAIKCKHCQSDLAQPA